MHTIEISAAVEEILCLLEGLPNKERGRIAARMRELDEESGSATEAARAMYEVQPRLLSVDEYLSFEQESPIRHEYIGGHVHAMPGGTRRHNAISLQLAAAFTAHVRRGPCQAFMNGVKVRLRVDEQDILYYPDVLVTCDRRDLEDLEEVWVQHPALLVEVLSPSTAAIDRREKFQNYRHIEALQEYVLVSQNTLEVTVFRRSASWKPIVTWSREGVVEFQSIKLSLPLTQIYEGTLVV
jgi:Uma2 family endonuclease